MNVATLGVAGAVVLSVSLWTPLTAQNGGVPGCQADNPYCEQVTALGKRADVRRAFDYVERTDASLLKEQIALSEIPSPPFKEQARGKRYAELLKQAGADSVWVDDVGNVIALRRGRVGGRTVVLAGHLDTVFPEGTDFTVTVRGDTLFGPGIGDDTRGLMVVLQTLRALEAARIETDANLLFVGTVGEEGLGDLRGAKNLFGPGGPKIDAFISVDGGGNGGIVNQGLGSRRYRVTFRGPGGHSWGAFGLGNPAHALGRAIEVFDEAADTLTSTGPRTSYNVGRIGGGTSINSIPFQAWMEVDMRSVSPDRLMTIDSVFRAAMQRALAGENAVRRDGPPLTVEVKLIGDRPSGETPPGDPLVLRAEAVTRNLGFEPRLSISSTDSNIPISHGVPAVTIGRGGEGGANHSPAEWWRNVRGTLAIRRVLLLVLAQSGASAE